MCPWLLAQRVPLHIVANIIKWPLIRHNSDVVYLWIPGPAAVLHGGLWVTYDGGNLGVNSSVPASTALYADLTYMAGQIVIDPNSGTTGNPVRTKPIYVYSFGNGIYQCTDGSGTFSLMTASGTPTERTLEVRLGTASVVLLFLRKKLVQTALVHCMLWILALSSNPRMSRDIKTALGHFWHRDTPVYSTASLPLIHQILFVLLRLTQDSWKSWRFYRWWSNLVSQMGSIRSWLGLFYFTSRYSLDRKKRCRSRELILFVCTRHYQIRFTALECKVYGTATTFLIAIQNTVAQWNWTDQGLGIEEIASKVVICPPGSNGKPVVGGDDYADFYIC